MEKPYITINVDCTSLDVAIEKAKQLVELLKEAKALGCTVAELLGNEVK